MKLSETTSHGITCKCGEIFQTTDDLKDHIAAHRWQPDLQERETRQPTNEELESLIQWKQDRYDHNREEAVNEINQCYYVVIEDYQTGCPGYTGRVLIEIGSAGPSFHTVYTWNNGILRRRDQANELRHNGGER